MIKKLFAPALLLTLLISCNSNETDPAKQKKNEQEQQQDKEKKISKRDLSINKTNAYSDLFFDSTALVKFFADNKTDDTLKRRMTSFYNAHNYQFAWFTSTGPTEQARGFWNMHNYQVTYGKDSLLNDKALQKRMDGYVEADSLAVSATDNNIITTELKLTQHFILYALNTIEDGYVKRKEMERFIPRKKEDALLLADSLLTKKHKDNKYYEDVNTAYKSLKEQLGKYYAISQQGGWPAVTASVKQLKKGASSPLVNRRF